jgi:hypothetical protein
MTASDRVKECSADRDITVKTGICFFLDLQSFKDITFELIMWDKSQEEIENLLIRVRQQNPGNS